MVLKGEYFSLRQPKEIATSGKSTRGRVVMMQSCYYFHFVMRLADSEHPNVNYY